MLGGRSMGGRYCSMVVGADDDPVPALGLLMLSYPLHAAGKPEKPRAEHFPRIRVPVLFVSGTRDCPGRAGRRCRRRPGRSRGRSRSTGSTPPTTATGPLKASGRTTDDVLAEVAATAADWVAGLPVNGSPRSMGLIRN